MEFIFSSMELSSQTENGESQGLGQAFLKGWPKTNPNGRALGSLDQG